MVMVRQHAPRDSPGCVPLQHVQQIGGEAVHALRGKPDMGSVFIAGGGDEEMEVAVIGSVWRRMPRVPIILAPGENFFALLGSELSPDVTWRGHGQRYGVPASAGLPVTFSPSLKHFTIIKI